VRSIPMALLLVPALALAESDRPATADVNLTVHTRGNESTLQVGQVIELELSFTSAKPKAYQIDMATYDRSGRLNAETFAIKPAAGWEDPLELYFHSWSGFIGGGLRGFDVLSAKPTVIHLQLNEWVQFARPGQYRVTVTSGRVSRLSHQFFGRGGIRVASNELLLTIAPATPEWQGQTLQSAVAALDGPKEADQRKEAIKALRYLGTPAAAREMADRLNEPDLSWDYVLGIAGSPAREAALEEMRSLLRDPDFPISDQFLSTMAIAALPAHATGDVPAQRDALETRFRQELAAVLATKRNGALAVSADTLAEGGVSPELRRKATEVLVATFEQLPVEKQAEVLRDRWKDLDHEAILPSLRTVARRYKEFPQLSEMKAYRFNNASAAALQHWYEMEPEAARAAILEEILRPHPRFGASVLGILPDKELQEADQPLAEHLLRDSRDFNASDNLASLIHRYASRALESQVTSYLDGRIGKLACDIQAPLLAYLLKQDPPKARSLLQDAIAARGEAFSACNHSLLTQVGNLQNDSLIEEIAVPALDDPDPEVVDDAAAYLAQRGSAAAEGAVWARFVAWSRRWAGHEAELRNTPGQTAGLLREAGVGSNLMTALAGGQAWLTSDAKLRRLIALSVGRRQRQEAKAFLRAWQTRPWEIRFIPFEQGQF